MRTWAYKLLLAWFLVCALCLGTNVSARDAIDISPNTDVPGGDYRSIKFSTFDQCLNLCATEKRCAAFTFNQRARVCFLKEKVGQKIQFVGAKSGIKKTKNISEAINAKKMDDVCSFEPENIDTAISVFRDGVVPSTFTMKNWLHHSTGDTEITYWHLKRAADLSNAALHLLLVRTGTKRYYWCSDDRAGRHGSWTLDEKFSDFKKGYFTLNSSGCSGIGMGCSTASIYHLFGNSLSKPLYVTTRSYDFATGYWRYEKEFKISEISCHRKCSVYGDGFIEYSHTWEAYGENRRWYVVKFDSKAFFRPRVDYQIFNKLSQIVDKIVGGERPASPEAFSREAQKVFKSWGVAFPGMTIRLEGEQ
jgi:hypothetical protein